MFEYTYNLDNALTSQAKEIAKGTEDTTFVDPTPGSGEAPEDKKNTGIRESERPAAKAAFDKARKLRERAFALSQMADYLGKARPADATLEFERKGLRTLLAFETGERPVPEPGAVLGVASALLGCWAVRGARRGRRGFPPLPRSSGRTECVQ